MFQKKKTSRSDILFLGLCEAGKTKLYTMLMGVGDKETFTSIKENVGEYTAKNVRNFPIISFHSSSGELTVQSMGG